MRWIFAPLGKMLRLLALPKGTYDAWCHRGLFDREFSDSADARQFTALDGLRLQVMIALGQLGTGAPVQRIIGQWKNLSQEITHLVFVVSNGELLAIPCLSEKQLPTLTQNQSEYLVVSVDAHRRRLAQLIEPHVHEWQSGQEPEESQEAITIRRGKANVVLHVGDVKLKYAPEEAAALAMKILTAADATIEARQEMAK